MLSWIADSARAVGLDERAVRGATRERLDAERAAAGVQVGDQRADDDVEAARALNIASRTRSVVGRVDAARRRRQPAPTELPGHDAHRRQATSGHNAG